MSIRAALLIFLLSLTFIQADEKELEHLKAALALSPETHPENLDAQAERAIEELVDSGQIAQAERWARDLISLPRHPKWNALDLQPNGLPYESPGGLARLGRKKLIQILLSRDPARLLREADSPYLAFCELPLEKARLARAKAEVLAILGKEAEARRQWEEVKAAGAAWENECEAGIKAAMQRKLDAGHPQETATKEGETVAAAQKILRAELDTWLMEPLPKPRKINVHPAHAATQSLWQPRTAPDWSLPDPTGKMHNLADFKGRPVLLNFYIDHACERCLEQLGELAGQADALKNLGLTVIAISLDEVPSLSKLKIPALKGSPLPFLTLADPQARTFEAYHVFDTESKVGQHGMVLIDAAGNIRWHDSAETPFRDFHFLLGEVKRQLALARKQ